MTSRKLIALLFSLLLLLGLSPVGEAAGRTLDSAYGKSSTIPIDVGEKAYSISHTPAAVDTTRIISANSGRSESIAHLKISKASVINEPDSISKRLSLGGSHSALIDNNGALWLWGSNDQGQLGDGTMTDRLSPVKVMTDVSKVSLGVYHSAAIKKDGSLWVWGQNISGQLGNGKRENVLKPVKIMENVADISMGYDHSAAVTKDGTLYTWGVNTYGQLGDGTCTDRNKPVKVLTNVKEVSLGANHSAALKNDGSMYTWGSNLDGALGDGTYVDKTIPTKVLSNIRYIDLGYYHSAAINTSNELLTWGQNFHGELGDNSGDRRNRPVKVLEDIAYVSLGGSHSMALTKQGIILSWGWNGFGEIGNGSRIESFKPNSVLKDAVALCAGTYHSAAITEDGVLMIWGRNEFGELGDGTRQNKTRPKQIWTGLKIGGSENEIPGHQGDSPNTGPTEDAPEEDDPPDDGTHNHTPILVVSVNIPDEQTLTVGQNDVTLSANVFPETADNPSLSWTSSNSSVVSVNDSTGRLTSKSPGKATVTAKAKDGSGAYDTCKVTVLGLDVKMTSLSVPSSLSLGIGETQTITPSIRPSNTSNKRVTWTTSNSKVVAISTSGKVKAKKAGSAVITVKSVDGSNLKDTCRITVSETKITSISLGSAISMKANETRTLKAAIKPDNAANKSLRWTSSAPAVVSVNSSTGKLNARKAGTATITAAALDGSGVKGTVKVTVTQNIKVERIHLPATHVMKISTTKTLVHTVIPSDATNKSVEWKSSKPAVVSVHPTTGKMTANKKGTAIVTVKANDGSGVKANCKVSVSGTTIKVTKISIPSRYSLKEGGSATLKATVRPENASNKTLTWSTSNPSIVSINSVSGRMTAKGSGTAIITVKATDGSGKQDACIITVKNTSVASVVNPKAESLDVDTRFHKIMALEPALRQRPLLYPEWPLSVKGYSQIQGFICQKRNI